MSSAFLSHTVHTTPDFFLKGASESTFNATESVWVLLLKALIAALTSGIGGFPLYFLGRLSSRVMGFCIIFAAGLMTGCSVVLFMESYAHSSIFTALLSTLFGIILTWGVSLLVPDSDNISFVGLTGNNARKSLLIILSMSLHSLGEGISVGVSARSEQQHIGLLVICALAIHNIPEGIATSIILMGNGMDVCTASFLSVLSNLPQPLIAVPSFIFFEYFTQLLPLGFGLASGAMFYVVVVELIPESNDRLSKSYLLSTFFTALGIILSVSVCATHAEISRISS